MNIKAELRESNRCTCSSHNPITCAANMAGVGRASIILAKAPCYCLCHFTRLSQPVSEAAWRAGRVAEPEKARVAR